MRERVFGIETEYALIYHPGRGETGRPSNLELYQLFEPLVCLFVRTLPRAVSLLRSKPGHFLENGGSFHYEATPGDFEHGLIEMASPECRDPFSLLCHERAKDELVETVCGEVNERLRAMGRRGEVRIGKNNVDSQGHTFGSHENYLVEDALPLHRKLLLLPLWLALWVATLPVLAWLILASLVVAGASLALLFLPPAAALLRGAAALLAPWPVARRRLERRAHRLARLPHRVAARLRAEPGELARRLAWLELPLRPAIAAHSWLYNQFHFRRLERSLTAFLVTRTLYCGAGAVVLDGGPLLRLAQRPPFLRSLSRIFTSGDNRPVFETRDVFFRPWSAFGSRRRLHLMHGDANLCDWAQVLRIGATALVLEAIEAAGPDPWPVLARPLDALQELNRDSLLQGKLMLADGALQSAAAIQRGYLEGVRRLLPRETLEPWKQRVLDMWQETLDLLDRDPEALADRVDWIAKRALLHREIPRESDRQNLEARGAAALDPAAEAQSARLRDLAYRALRVDLRYHELGPRGGHRRLLRGGRVRELVERAAVERAWREPPTATRAFGRGRAIREARERGLSGGVSWHRVRLGWRRWRWFANPLSPSATLSLGDHGPSGQGARRSR